MNLDFIENNNEFGKTGYILGTISKWSNPKIILELGIRGGVSSRIFAATKPEQCEHHMCDMEDCSSHISDILKKNNSFFHLKKTEVLSKEWDKEIDILFVDANHDFDCVLSDFLNFDKYVNENGWVIFHDTCPPNIDYTEKHLCSDAYKIRDFIVNNKKNYEAITIPWSFGLTICRKKRKDNDIYE